MRVIGFSTAAALCLLLQAHSVVADDTDRRRVVLTALTRDFKLARKLPAGSRPAPPSVDLNALVGIPATRVRSALGRPDRPLPDYDYECGAEHCWAFTYGSLREEEPTVVAEQDGSKTIIVTTGGPYLLVLGISGKQVTTAKWQGQK